MQTSLHVERDNQETTRVKIREILNPKPKSTRRERERERRGVSVRLMQHA
jgi:hypothetical protein